MKFICRETFVETREYEIPDHLLAKMDDDDLDSALEDMRCETDAKPQDLEVIDVAWERRP